MQSGHVASNPEGDAARLKSLSGVPTQENEICPYSIEEPLAPRLAMKRAGRVVKLKEITDYYNELLKEFNSLFVEGAGGLAVPYTEDALVIDFAKEITVASYCSSSSYIRNSKSYSVNDCLRKGAWLNRSGCHFIRLQRM